MRMTWRTILLVLFALLVAGFCATGVSAQERPGRRGREMRGDQGSHQQNPQARPRNWDGFDGSYDLSPWRNQRGPRPYDSGRDRRYNRRPQYRSDSWGHRSYGYRYGYGRPYGYRYNDGYRRGCSTLVYDAYGRAYWVPGYRSYGYYRSVCIPY